MAREFKYAEAWRSLIIPAYKNLVPELREALNKAAVLLKDSKQDSNTLDIPMTPEVKAVLDPFNVDALSLASYVIYFLGHWRDSGNLSTVAMLLDIEPEVFNGGSWKVSNVIDQILSHRLGLPRERRNSKHPNGVYFYNGVHEGRLRIALSTRNMWVWHEVCWATHKPALPHMPKGDRRFANYYWEAAKHLEKWAKEISSIAFRDMDTEPFYHDPDAFKVPSPERFAKTSDKKFADVGVGVDHLREYLRNKHLLAKGVIEEIPSRLNYVRESLNKAGVTRVSYWVYPKRLPSTLNKNAAVNTHGTGHDAYRGSQLIEMCLNNTVPQRIVNRSMFGIIGFEVFEVWFKDGGRRVIITDGTEGNPQGVQIKTSIPDEVWKKIKTFNKHMEELKRTGSVTQTSKDEKLVQVEY